MRVPMKATILKEHEPRNSMGIDEEKVNDVGENHEDFS